jgi:hypothetical protein
MNGDQDNLGTELEQSRQELQRLQSRVQQLAARQRARFAEKAQVMLASAPREFAGTNQCRK